MTNTIKNFISLVLQESLKKDIERHELARQIYAFVFKGLEDLQEVNPEEYFVTRGESPKLEVYLNPQKAGAAQIFATVNTLSEDVKTAMQLASPPILYINFSIKERTPEDKESMMTGGTYAFTIDKTAKINVYCNKEELSFKGNATNEQKVSETLRRIFSSRKNTIVHEVAHMLDDISLVGAQTFRRQGIYNVSPETGTVKIDKRYFDASTEVNARWVEVIDEIDPLQYSDYDPEDKWKFDAWLFNAKQTVQFDRMSPAKQRKFIGRLWDFYTSGPYQLPANRVEEAAQEIFKDFKDYVKRLLSPDRYPPNQNTRSSMEYLGTLQGYMENAMEGYSWGKLQIRDTFRVHYTEENTKKIINRVKVLVKPVEEEFKREFAKVADEYLEEW